jgi:aminopeptidase
MRTRPSSASASVSSMADPRDREYAELLVGTCLGVEAGWQVLVLGSELGRPLLEEVQRSLARRGAYALTQLTFSGGLAAADRAWVREAPLELLAKPAPLYEHLMREADAFLVVQAPENTRDPSATPVERTQAVQAAYRPAMERLLSHEVPWVGCQYPTPALAQDAGLSTEEFADFLYGACLLDWDLERERMSGYAARFDAADEVRIVGDGTDLRLSIAGRTMLVDAGGANIPGGEFFGCPIEDSAEGTISFSEFPGVHGGRHVSGIRFRFEAGRIVEASSDSEEDYLLKTLDTDDGARRVGELGIGCNPGITRHMRNTLFDEKIDGTVHVAVGNGFPDLGGTNVSNVHWDIVKDLRTNGQLYLDGELVQENGRWLI